VDGSGNLQPAQAVGGVWGTVIRSVSSGASFVFVDQAAEAVAADDLADGNRNGPRRDERRGDAGAQLAVRLRVGAGPIALAGGTVAWLFRRRAAGSRLVA